MKYIAQDNVNVNIDYPIIISGYKESMTNAIQVISCIDAISAVAYNIIDHLIESNECFVHPIEGNVTHWRSFVPEGQSNIKFRAVSRSDSRIDVAPDILHYTVSSALREFVIDTNQDIMFIYGAPRKEYDSISSICRICWIYDSDWDDENTTDLVRYSSVQDAIQRCTKFQINVCNTDQWLLQLESNNCLVCILSDTLDVAHDRMSYKYMTLDKFIICTNSRNHEFIRESLTQCIIFDLDTPETSSIPNIISKINGILASPAPLLYKHIIASQSICSYIQPRVLFNILRHDSSDR